MTLLIYLVNDLKFFLIFSCLAAAGLSCGAQDLRCVMWALSLLTWSVVVAQGLSCSIACGIFPHQGSKPCLLHWQADSLSLSHQGSPWLSVKLTNKRYISYITIFKNKLILHLPRNRHSQGQGLTRQQPARFNVIQCCWANKEIKENGESRLLSFGGGSCKHGKWEAHNELCNFGLEEFVWTQSFIYLCSNLDACVKVL